MFLIKLFIYRNCCIIIFIIGYKLHLLNSRLCRIIVNHIFLYQGLVQILDKINGSKSKSKHPARLVAEAHVEADTVSHNWRVRSNHPLIEKRKTFLSNAVPLFRRREVRSLKVFTRFQIVVLSRIISIPDVDLFSATKIIV